MLGRNILQAASGSANAAADWIRDFRRRTSGMKPAKRKALLDGILFEIFFDSEGERRKEPKANFFNEVFELEEYPEFKDSFEFIAGVLSRWEGRFFAVPGKGQKVTVDVHLNDKRQVTGAFVAGRDYLAKEDEISGADDGDDEVVYRTLKRLTFEEDLSRQMLVPVRLLKVVYDKAEKELDKVKFPYGYEVQRPGTGRP